jgi:hypothetical protein
MQGEDKYEILVQHGSGHVKVKIFLIDDMYGRVEIHDLPILRYACGFLHKEKYLQDGEYKKVKISDLLRFAITEGIV